MTKSTLMSIAASMIVVGLLVGTPATNTIGGLGIFILIGCGIHALFTSKASTA